MSFLRFIWQFVVCVWVQNFDFQGSLLQQDKFFEGWEGQGIGKDVSVRFEILEGLKRFYIYVMFYFLGYIQVCRLGLRQFEDICLLGAFIGILCYCCGLRVEGVIILFLFLMFKVSSKWFFFLYIFSQMYKFIMIYL